METNGILHSRSLLKGPRPPLSTQHSNSVPSTPRQLPHDLRFPTRSPSPNSSLRRGSPPTSSARNAATLAAPARSTPVVCKFETGAEFRKRRIPYKDGGNEVLAKPETEPRARLEPQEEARLTEDMRCLYESLLPSEESEGRRARMVQKLKDILSTAWPEEEIQVNVFGSSGNLLSSTDSDVDICLTTEARHLESMHSLATVLHENGMEKVVCRASAKVPIIKLWDPELELACDINVNNPLALDNTRMIKTYVQIDERVRPLAKIVKYWTKQRLLNDAAYGGTISSYTWICMVINFLQTRDPPIIPSLQLLPDDLKSVSTDGERSPFADKLEGIRGFGEKNTESLGQLLFSFFRFYAYEIDYQESVVCVREGRLLDRSEKGWETSNYHEKEARSRLCVEEPFNTIRNLGNSADEYAFNGIHEEVRRAFGLIAQVDLQQCCEQFVFPPEPEKSIFQRAVPKPKPVLTRSASQSSRTSNHQNITGRHSSGASATRSQRAPSTHRSGNRRASSGASYAGRYAQSPFATSPIGPDYFGSPSISQEQIHEQLYKQYQVLQAKQEALRTQLLQQQQQQQAQWQHGSPTTSRQRLFANSVSSPRTLDGTTSSPLLPGYLYHYPAPYPTTGSPTTLTSGAARTAGLTQTSSGHSRPNMGPGSSAAVRSQSQPGRSYPSPVTLQSMAHPGYDVSGVVGSTYVGGQPLHIYTSQQQRGIIDLNGLAQLSQLPANAAESPIPKEYVGYYVGQSMQGLPAGTVLQPTPMPRRPRRSSPERPTGVFPSSSRRSSQSPPKVNRERHSSDVSVMSTPSVPQTPTSSARKLMHIDTGGPIIVNGSTTSTPTVARNDPVKVHAYTVASEQASNGANRQSDGTDTASNMEGSFGTVSLPAENNHNSMLGPAQPPADPQNGADTRRSPSLEGRSRPTPPKLALVGNGEAQCESEELKTPGAASILSPVAEMRTPSPTGSRGHNTPRAGVGGFTQMIQPDQQSVWGGGIPKGEQPLSSGHDQSKVDSEIVKPTTLTKPQQQQWQQAVKKGHKKGVTTSTGGESMPKNMADRKGG